MSYTDDFFNSYVECALWASRDWSGEALDENYSAHDLSTSARIAMASDCIAFALYSEYDSEYDLSGIDAEQAGHDFWLTRNRHGAGFWDRGLGELGVRLTVAAHAYGEQDLYVGDDGRIYVA